jgi:hypothetical protein
MRRSPARCSPSRGSEAETRAYAIVLMFVTIEAIRRYLPYRLGPHADRSSIDDRDHDRNQRSLADVVASTLQP